LWSPKPIDGVYKHTTHFVRKLRTYTTLKKLIWWYFDALNVIFSTIFAKLYLPKLLKSTKFPLKIPYKWLLKSTKTKKSPSPYVCHHKNRFTCRTNTPFVSADAHRPKDVFQSKFWFWKSFQKFFCALPTQSITFARRQFLMLQMRFWSKFIKIHANHEKIATSARLSW